MWRWFVIQQSQTDTEGVVTSSPSYFSVASLCWNHKPASLVEPYRCSDHWTGVMGHEIHSWTQSYKSPCDLIETSSPLQACFLICKNEATKYFQEPPSSKVLCLANSDLFMQTFCHLINQYLLRACYMPGHGQNLRMQAQTRFRPGPPGTHGPLRLHCPVKYREDTLEGPLMTKEAVRWGQWARVIFIPSQQKEGVHIQYP